jgi:hypothetical protein
MQQKKSIRGLRKYPNKNGNASGNILLKVQPTIKTIANRIHSLDSRFSMTKQLPNSEERKWEV